MARIRRKQSRIAGGIISGLQNALKFGSKRRNEVMDSLQEEREMEEPMMGENYFDNLMNSEIRSESVPGPVPFVSGTQPVPPVHSSQPFAPVPPVSSDSPVISSDEDFELEDGIKGLAISAHKLGRENELRAMFLLFINNYTKYIKENSLDPDLSLYTEMLETKKEQLDEFDKEIEVLKTEEKIKQTVHSINSIAEAVKESLDELVKELARGDLSNLNSRFDDLNLKISGNVLTPSLYQVSSLNSSKEELISLLNKYEKLTGEFRTFIEFDLKIPFEDKFIEEYYRAIAKAMKDPNVDAKYSDTLKEYIKLFALLTEDYLRFDEIKNLVDKELLGGPEKPEPSSLNPELLENIRRGYEALVEVKYKAICDKILSLATEFKYIDDELKTLLAELETIRNNEKSLDSDVKDEIENRMAPKYNGKIVDALGEDLYNFIFDYAEELEYKIEEVKRNEYGTSEFEYAYKSLKETIAAMTKASLKCGVKVEFDEENQKLSMDFLSSIMKPYEAQVVSDNTLKAMRGSKEPEKPTVSPKDLEKENQKALFTKLVGELGQKYDAIIEQQLRTLMSVSKLDVDKELVALFSDSRFYLLDSAEKNKIIDEINLENAQRNELKYGVGFIDFVNKNIISNLYHSGIRDLENMSAESEEFESKYQAALENVKAMVKDLQNNSVAGNYVKSVSYDEVTQELVIEYADGYYISKSEAKIISDAVMQKLEAAKRKKVDEAEVHPVPPVPPVQPVPPAQPVPPVGEPSHDLGADEQKDIEDYINKLEEINEIVDLINELNLKLEAQAVMSSIRPNEVKDTIFMEAEAKDLDQKLMTLKVELSKDRLKFKQKYNKYMLSLPEVKAVSMKEVVFSGDLSAFIAQHDEMIVEAENKIFEIAEQKEKGLLLERDANAVIQELLDFIEAQNSLVGRRLVSEAKDSSFDIVSLLQQRRENKKDIREKLRQVREDSIHEPVVEEPAAQEPEKAEESHFNVEIYTQDLDELQRALDNEVRRQIIESRRHYSDEPFEARFTQETKNLITNFNTKYNLPATHLIDEAARDYANILGREEISSISSLFDSINSLRFSITDEDVLSDEFDTLLNKKLDSIMNRYNDLTDLRVTFDSTLNAGIVKYTSEKYNFENYYFEIEPANVIISNFLPVELYDIYKDKKKQEVVMSNEILENVAMYFIESYSNGMVVFKAVAHNQLMRRYGYTLEEVEAAIQILSDKGIVENRNGVLSAKADVEELHRVLAEMSELKDQETKDEAMGQNGQGQEQNETQINIVQRGLSFNPRNLQQLSDKSKDIITTGDAVTISLIKNGIKIKYSQELREKLSQLNAKLSLVNKDNYRIRASQAIDSEEQTVGFKDEREINPEDYKIEIRVPSDGETNALYEFDLENVSEELKAHTK